ncbi:hypothetical protein PS662_00472 [Pseudomonas fluorescens]|uniref:Uncharacterized protein n=1 Tax=Pseudomonas fluorescens TaxID=294 RepID=A0A5E6PSL1_PSEFL|nr:hypothetical protein PS662_00472 [Pseudomonas fluorescens]
MGRTIRWVQTFIRLMQGSRQQIIFGIGLHNCLQVLNRLRS